MKQSIAKKWVAALRSGEYRQGENGLKDNGRFSCLGVLCHISKLSRWKSDSYLGEFSGLPGLVQEWAGMESMCGKFSDECFTSVDEQNDTGNTFPEIADIIEKNWEKL
jgi:hypothetical protein